MADTSLTQPVTFSGVTAAGLSPNLVVAAGAFYRRNVEAVEDFARQLGLRVVLIGRGGVKSTRFGNTADPASYSMTALSSETEVPPTVGDTLGYDSITVAPYGMAMADTYDKHIFATDQLVNETGVMKLMRAPQSPVLANLRGLAATAIAGISSSVGSTSAKTSLDTLIAAAASFEQTRTIENRVVSGEPILALHSVQVSHVKESARTEPGYQSTGESMRVQGIMSEKFVPDFMGLGMTLYRTDDITNSAGGYNGGLFDRGTMIVGFGDTSGVPVPEAGMYMAIPELGIIMQEDATTIRQRLKTLQLYTYQGVAMGDTNVGRQLKVIGSTS